MALTIPVVWSDDCSLHDPAAEIWIGVRTPAVETAARTDAILEELRGGGAEIVDAEGHDDAALHAVHDPELVRYLASAWDAWQKAGLPTDPGQDRVVPYVFAHAALTPAPTAPTAIWARPGHYCYDTMTLIGPGTWEAARAAADSALTAVDLVLEGAPVAYACCRPPGHHVCRACYGGSCYLNNAAIAAGELARRVDGPVAVIDIDAHHGNGTQEIFWHRDDVLVGSVHVDPGAGTWSASPPTDAASSFACGRSSIAWRTSCSPRSTPRPARPCTGCFCSSRATTIHVAGPPRRASRRPSSPTFG